MLFRHSWLTSNTYKAGFFVSKPRGGFHDWNLHRFPILRFLLHKFIPSGSSSAIMHPSIPPARSAPPPPSPGYCGAFARLVSPGGICNFSHCLGAGHLPTPGQFPSFWPQADHPLLVGAVVELRSFVIYRRNTHEQYSGYCLFQNAEFKANFSIKVWRKC